MPRKRNRQTKGSSLPAELAGKLAAYSTLAGAALAMGSPAQAAIHAFTPPAPLLVDMSHMINLDIDGDGTKDFVFSVEYQRGSTAYHVLELRRNDPANRFDFNSSHPALHGLQAGESADNLRDANQASLMKVASRCYESYRCDPYGYDCTTTWWCYSAHWVNPLAFNHGERGYIGVRFRNRSGRDLNGWILFEGGANPTKMAGTILGWAYEDSGSPIAAGEKSNKKLLTFLPDLNGNQTKEFALLLEERGVGRCTWVLFCDTGTGSEIKLLGFLNRLFHPVSLARIDDLSGPGKPALAILGVRKDAAGKILQVRVPLRDARTSDYLREISFSRNASPVALFWLDDMNGNGSPELAVLGNNLNSGRSTVQIRDSLTGTGIKTLTVAASRTVLPVALWSIPDRNGNGSWELAVLERDIQTGRSWIQVVDPLTATPLSTIPCLNSRLIPLAMAWVRDMNQNGFPEQAILAKSKTGSTVVVEIRDMLSGEALKKVYFDNHFEPVGFAAADVLGNKNFELAVLGIDPIDGSARLEIRSAITGAQLKTLPVP